MSQSFGTIIQRLRQTLYNLSTREFTNRAIVKYDSSVSDNYDSFDLAMLQWQSTQKNGQDPVSSDQAYILLLKKGDFGCCEAVGVVDHASMFATSVNTIENFLSEGKKKFVLSSTDFEYTNPVGLQTYYVYGKNDLRILQTLVDHTDGTFKELSEFLIKCENARGFINTGTIPQTTSQVTLSSSVVYSYGVCPCKYNC